MCHEPKSIFPGKTFDAFELIFSVVPALLRALLLAPAPALRLTISHSLSTLLHPEVLFCLASAYTGCSNVFLLRTGKFIKPYTRRGHNHKVFLALFVCRCEYIPS